VTRRTAWITGFLAVTALAVTGELWAAFDASDNTVPWTDLLVRYVPWPVTAMATAILVAWLPAHFALYYRRGRQPVIATGRYDMNPEPLPAPPNPNTSSTEPLLTVGGAVAVITALLDLAILFGLHMSDAQTAGVLAVVNVLAPFAVALWGRRKVYAPATVSALIAAARR
jgi:hypothetical protein